MLPDDPLPQPVRVEVLVVSASDAALCYRTLSADAIGARHPDAVAAGLAVSPVIVRPAMGPAGHGGAQCDGPQPVWAPPSLTILHSTSWRFTDGQVVLTYVAVLDGVPDPASRPLLEHGIAHSGDPTSPSPPEVCPDAVATHAARHLAWLRGTDAVVGAALAGVPGVWQALDRFEPAPAGVAPLL